MIFSFLPKREGGDPKKEGRRFVLLGANELKGTKRAGDNNAKEGRALV